jgi:elongation factor Ts
MIQGRIDKFYTDTVLIQQPFVKDQSVTITDLVNQLTAKTGEKVSIRRFTRYKMGEGIEKRVDDFAAEVAAMSK